MRVSLLVLVCFVMVPSLSVAGVASERPCFRLLKGKQHIQAARCYKSLLSEVAKHQKWQKDAPLFKDRFLRHAALSYRAAALEEKVKGKSGYYREQAIQLLQLSFQKGYCEASQRCRGNRLLADQLKREIGYTPLLVITGQRRAQITVQGYQYKQTRFQNFNKPLRPGQYTVVIKYPKRGERRRRVSLRPRHQVTINASLAQIKVIEKRIIVARKIPPLVLAGYIGGGALALVGAGLLTYGLVEQGRLNDIYLDPVRNRELSQEEYESGFQRADVVKIIGGVLAGLGGVVLVGGLIAHLTSGPPPRPAPPAVDVAAPTARSLTLLRLKQ